MSSRKLTRQRAMTATLMAVALMVAGVSGCSSGGEATQSRIESITAALPVDTADLPSSANTIKGDVLQQDAEVSHVLFTKKGSGYIVFAQEGDGPVLVKSSYDPDVKKTDLSTLPSSVDQGAYGDHPSFSEADIVR